MTATRCAAPRCGRFVPAGTEHCDKHESAGKEADAAHAAFLARLEQGSYAGLFDEQIREVMTQAATAMRAEGLSEEIGALRYVLARPINEEHDLARLTAAVTKIATAAVQTARAQRAINGESAEGLTSAVTQILAELDEE